jgi:hypothetical protein
MWGGGDRRTLVNEYTIAKNWAMLIARAWSSSLVFAELDRSQRRKATASERGDLVHI